MTTDTITRRAAPASKRVLRQAFFEAGVLLRNGEQLLVAVILPALALVGLMWTTVPELPEPRIDAVVPGVLALAVVSTAFTGQAISTAFDRRNGVLRLLGTTPLGRDGLLVGKILAVGTVLLIHLGALSLLGFVFEWKPALTGVLPALISVVLGVATFVALAMLVAGRLRAEAVLAVANLLWVIFLGLGLLLPVVLLPAGLETLARLLPSGALGESLRLALIDGSWPLGEWVVLLCWFAVAAFGASRTFRWSD